ncbi:MAG TPA: SDR family oxidoreductase [Cyclobacteriaceae bacterium]|jgi:NAD(P)-dependent dehydrogenase (short-subunit alcohol dehydrogenase family)
MDNGMLKEGALKDKVILVTGGGTGLGKEMATYMSRLGAKIAILSRKEEVLKKSAQEMSSASGNEVMPITCDIRKYEDVEKSLEAIESQLGKLTSVLNNAAGNFVSPTERLSHRAFDTVVDIVLRGSYNVTLAMGKKWLSENQKGTFLNIVTTYAWTGSGYVVPSACAKAGVLALTRSLAVEWGKYGIRSNAIAPGPFPTQGAWTRLFPGDLAKKIDPIQRIPLGRVGEYHELANLAAYLISDYSGYINGEVVTIDGGEWLKGAGEFNQFEMIPDALWDAYEQMRKGSKG